MLGLQTRHCNITPRAILRDAICTRNFNFLTVKQEVPTYESRLKKEIHAHFKTQIFSDLSNFRQLF